MSDSSDNEIMRPIPDGGLRESMPGWLKRPPAWRSKLSTPEERFERSLPAPDTSTIDPSTLVTVDDLPQWLKNIAARGPIAPTEPDPATEHAVEMVQAAQQRTEPVESESMIEASDVVDTPESGPDREPVVDVEEDVVSEDPEQTVSTPEGTEESQPPKAVNSETDEALSTPWLSFGVASIAIVLAGILIILWLYL